MLIILICLFLIAGIIISWGNASLNADAAKDMWVTFWIEFFIIGILLLPAYYNKFIFLGIITVLSICSTFEMRLALIKCNFKISSTLPLFLSILFPILAFKTNLFVFSNNMAIVILYIFYIYIFYQMSKSTKLVPWAGFFFVVSYPALFIAFLVKINSVSAGFYYLFYLYLIVEVHDSAAMLVGRYLGKRKVWPNISPHKTYGGVLAGILMATLIALVCRSIVNFTMKQAFVCSLLLISLAICGDILTSLIKRQAGLKDFSNIVPTQGGILDVYDSLIFAAPGFYFYLKLVHLT